VAVDAGRDQHARAAPLPDLVAPTAPLLRDDCPGARRGECSGSRPGRGRGRGRDAMNIAYLALVTAMLTTATPLVLAALGEVITERAGILNLGIEGTMYAGAFTGFVGAELTGSPWWGLVVAI